MDKDLKEVLLEIAKLQLDQIALMEQMLRVLKKGK